NILEHSGSFYISSSEDKDEKFSKNREESINNKSEKVDKDQVRKCKHKSNKSEK
ncbi:24396_t:CDS:2, partial [Cetraspora pellucida]